MAWLDWKRFTQSRLCYRGIKAGGGDYFSPALAYKHEVPLPPFGPLSHPPFVLDPPIISPGSNGLLPSPGEPLQGSQRDMHQQGWLGCLVLLSPRYFAPLAKTQIDSSIDCETIPVQCEYVSFQQASRTSTRTASPPPSPPPLQQQQE